MTRAKRTWNNDFKVYMETIASHPNYRGLPIKRKDNGELAWIAPAETEIGQARIRWAKSKTLELGLSINQHKPFAQVMLEIHPTKTHVCQICGSRMSVFYHYLNANFIKTIYKKFNILFTACDHVEDIWNQILAKGFQEDAISLFFERNFKLTNVGSLGKDEIISLCERKCREGENSLLGPGAMSNFPDRFDGFHSYNRCCRSAQDKGRSRENLKTYTKDRRAYEYWSDGNIHAANQFLSSKRFDGTSADHIGPVSLGFVHDSHYLRPMIGGENSAKRDRLYVEDVDAILEAEKTTGIYPMSWYSAKIWEFIKSNYKKHPNIVATLYRGLLKQNMANLMFIRKSIIDCAGERGCEFLAKEFIVPKHEDFRYDYEFDEFGNITNQTPRHFTERSKNEMERFTRIAFESVEEYNDKSNRNLSPNLTDEEQAELDLICNTIKKVDFAACREMLELLVENIQNRLIRTTASV